MTLSNSINLFDGFIGKLPTHGKQRQKEKEPGLEDTDKDTLVKFVSDN